MKTDMSRLISYKVTDQRIQYIVLAVAVLLAFFTWFFSLFLLGGTHFISTLFWLFCFNNSPRLRLRRVVEVINILYVIVCSSLFYYAIHYQQRYLESLTEALIISGAVMGGLYFVLTAKEIKFYKSLSDHGKA